MSSATHVVYAAAYLRALVAACEGPVQVLVVAPPPFLGRPRLSVAEIERDLVRIPGLAVDSVRDGTDWRSSPQEALICLAIGAPGVTTWQRVLRANRRRPHVVVVDEGLGSYGGFRSRLAASRREGRSLALTIRRAATVGLASLVLTDERWSLHRLQAGHWTLDPNVAAEFHLRLGDPDPGPRSRDAVIVSQPWVELGQITADAYQRRLAAIATACRDAGLCPRVRLHPAEDRSRYRDLPLDPPGGPVELDRTVASAAVVLGVSSTALVNLHALYDTPVVRLRVPELAALDDTLTPRQRSLLDAYLPPPVSDATLRRALEAAAARAGGPGDA